MSTRIPCTLVKDDVTYNAELDIKSVAYREGIAVKEREIAYRNLVPGHTVPDGGPYTLRYVFNGKPYKERVRVVYGGLLNG